MEGTSAVCRIFPSPALPLLRPLAAGLLLSASVVHRRCMLPKPGLLLAVPLAAVLEVFDLAGAKSRPDLNRPARGAWEG